MEEDKFKKLIQTKKYSIDFKSHLSDFSNKLAFAPLSKIQSNVNQGHQINKNHGWKNCFQNFWRAI